MSLFDISGKVALVTGGNGGIGLAMARGIGAAGAAVMIGGRNAAKSEAAVAELAALGIDAAAVAAEVTDAAAVAAMVEAPWLALFEVSLFSPEGTAGDSPGRQGKLHQIPKGVGRKRVRHSDSTSFRWSRKKEHVFNKRPGLLSVAAPRLLSSLS